MSSGKVKKSLYKAQEQKTLFIPLVLKLIFMVVLQHVDIFNISITH
jgi:hypothetical protein